MSDKRDNKPSVRAGAKATPSTASQVAMAAQYYDGPIPPASEIERYEAVLVGAADRILTMAEEQSAHRRSMEDKMLEASIKTSQCGQIFGFTVFGVAIIAGFVLICIGKDIMGMVALLGSVTSIVTLFIGSRNSSKKELQEKDTKISKKHPS